MKDSGKTVAVIIPCYNEEKHIAKCLDGLLAGDYPHELLDIVVVDGMSADKTREIVREYCEKYACVRLLDNPRRLKPIALNLGIRNTTSGIVIRIDAHAEYETSYISKLVAGLDKYEADNIGGIRETVTGGSPIQQCMAAMVSHPFAIGNSYWRIAPGEKAEPRVVDTVFCGCYRRGVFDRIGLFNEYLIRTQDKEFNARLVAAGGKIVLDPDIRCCYYSRTGFGSYLKWNWVGAYWLFQASLYTDIKMLSLKNYIPMLFTLYTAVLPLVIAVSFFLPPGLAWSLRGISLIPLVIYLSLNCYFSSKMALKYRKFRYFTEVFFVAFILFPLTHWSYGMAALCGKLKSIFGKKHKWNQSAASTG